MTLYSLHGARPEPLPFRITLPNGFTRTDPSTFTEDEIHAAGFTGPYVLPPYDMATKQLAWVDGAYVVEPLPPPPPEPSWPPQPSPPPPLPFLPPWPPATPDNSMILTIDLIDVSSTCFGDAARVACM